MEIHAGLHQELHLSRKYPVLENLAGIDNFIEKRKHAFIEDPEGVFDIFLVGESGAGKGTVAEELLKHLAEDKDIRRYFRRQGQPTWKYYSLAMGCVEGYAAGSLASPWGEFTPEEFSRITEGMDLKLATTEYHPKPLVRAVESVAICEPPLNLGTELIKRAVKRAQIDPHYHYTVLGIASTQKVQKRATKVREGFLHSAQKEDVLETLRRNHMKPDTQDLDDVIALQRSTGNPYAMQRINGIDNANMITLQDSLRDFEPSLPQGITEAMLKRDDELRVTALTALMRYKFREWGVPTENYHIAVNPIIPRRKIPYYRRYVVTHKL